MVGTGGFGGGGCFFFCAGDGSGSGIGSRFSAGFSRCNKGSSSGPNSQTIANAVSAVKTI